MNMVDRDGARPGLRMGVELGIRPRLGVVLCTAALLAACGRDQSVVALPEEPPVKEVKAEVMRLVGDIDFHDDFVLAGKSAPPMVKRGMVVKGHIDQLVTVDTSGADERLSFQPVDGQALKLVGTVREQGAYHIDEPDSNSIVKADGTTLYEGPLNGEFSIVITRSLQGAGDEVMISLASLVPGKAGSTTTMSTGHSISGDDADAMPFITLLERDNDDPSRRKLKKDWWLFPVLGARPADPTSARLHDGMKALPGMFHIGASSAPDRSQWSYQGSKTYTDPSKPKDGITWTENLRFSLRLTKP